MAITSITSFNSTTSDVKAPNRSVSKGKSNLQTYLMYIVGIATVGMIVFFGGEIFKNLKGLKGKSGIVVDGLYGSYEVFINNDPVGKTKYGPADISQKVNKIKIKNDVRSYETSLNFLPNKGNGIFVDLGTSDNFSSVQEFWFEKEDPSNTLKIISEPSGAKIFLDNSEIGVTPYSSGKITAGEYDVKIEKEGYETQTTRISIVKDFSINLRAKMFPVPMPSTIIKMAGSDNIYDLSSGNSSVTSDTSQWAKGLVYWNATRNQNKTTFDLYLDYKGNFFDKDGNPIVDTATLQNLFKDSSNAPKIGYLGNGQSGSGFSTEAKDSFNKLSGTLLGQKKALIKSTPTGWLRVRSTPSTNGAELARVNTGTEYVVIEDPATAVAGWVKIKVSAEISGWVSSDYVEIK